MSDAVLVAIVGACSLVVGMVFQHTIPKWLEQRKSPSAKEEAEADGLRWQNFLEREKWRDEQIKNLNDRVANLEHDLHHARIEASAYQKALIENGIEPPRLAIEDGTVLSKAFPLPGGRK